MKAKSKISTDLFKHRLARLSWLVLLFGLIYSTGCREEIGDEPEPAPDFTGSSLSFNLGEQANSGFNGTITFREMSDRSTTIELKLQGASIGEEMPAHIYFFSLIENGNIAISLNNILPETGESQTLVRQLDRGQPITYRELAVFSGHVKVRQGVGSLGKIVVAGDIGGSLLSGQERIYNLAPQTGEEVNGEVAFLRRADGSTLVQTRLNNTEPLTDYFISIFNNTVEEGGQQAVIPLGVIAGESGLGSANIRRFGADNSPVTFEQLTNFNGHVRVLADQSQPSSVLAAGNIGRNFFELTGREVVYEVSPSGTSGISGTVTLAEITNGDVLARVELDSTSSSQSLPVRLRRNTFVEGGSTILTLNPVNGSTGLSITRVSRLDNEEVTSYNELSEFSGHFLVTQSDEPTAPAVARGDTGSFILTGETYSYNLEGIGNPDLTGVAELAERLDGSVLLSITLEGLEAGNLFPAQIAANSLLNAGQVILTLADVRGSTGTSLTQVTSLDDGQPIDFNSLQEINGHIRVLSSNDDPQITLAAADIGDNELIRTSPNYAMESVEIPGLEGADISGVLSFGERRSGEVLCRISLRNTPFGGSHPATVFAGSRNQGGEPLVMLENINGSTGQSITSLTALDDGTPMSFEDWLALEAHVTILLFNEPTAPIMTQGNIGANSGN